MEFDFQNVYCDPVAFCEQKIQNETKIVPIILGGITLGIAAATAIAGAVKASQEADAEEEALKMQQAQAKGHLSAAREAMKQAQNNATRQTFGMARSGPSSNPNLSMRNALEANQRLQANIAGQGAAAMAQERTQAIGQYAQLARHQGDLERARGAAIAEIGSSISQGIGAIGSQVAAQQEADAMADNVPKDFYSPQNQSYGPAEPTPRQESIPESAQNLSAPSPGSTYSEGAEGLSAPPMGSTGARAVRSFSDPNAINATPPAGANRPMSAAPSPQNIQAPPQSQAATVRQTPQIAALFGQSTQQQTRSPAPQSSYQAPGVASSYNNNIQAPPAPVIPQISAEQFGQDIEIRLREQYGYPDGTTYIQFLDFLDSNGITPDEYVQLQQMAGRRQ